MAMSVAEAETMRLVRSLTLRRMSSSERAGVRLASMLQTRAEVARMRRFPSSYSWSLSCTGLGGQRVKLLLPARRESYAHLNARGHLQATKGERGRSTRHPKLLASATM